MLALGLGALLRSSPGALGVGLGVLLLLHPLLAISETSAGDRIGRYVPALRVGEDAFLAVQTQAGLLVLGASAVAAWALGALLRSGGTSSPRWPGGSPRRSARWPPAAAPG